MAASIQAAQQQPQMPEGDPLDPEYQKKMYEAIQQKNVMENYEHALEHSPEVFGQVDMLYVDMSVNGEPVKAFIDSGAQVSSFSSGQQNCPMPPDHPLRPPSTRSDPVP